MQFVEGIRLALQQIWTEKLKSFFSLLGVIVGVMFLIVVVSIVEGLDRYITEDLASVAFGVNTVTLARTSDGPDFGGSDSRDIGMRRGVVVRGVVRLKLLVVLAHTRLVSMAKINPAGGRPPWPCNPPWE